MDDLKHKAVRGGAVKGLAQAANFVLRIGSMAVLARLLEPRDFGLVAMVTVMTNVLSLFKDAGLTVPTVRSPTITDAQLSTLFWLNLLVGVALTLICAAAASALAAFYRDERLVTVALWTAPSFLLTAIGVQHNALLERHLRFPVLSLIDVAAAFLSSLTGLTMALLSCGYWSLVGMTLVQPATSTVGVWIAARWLPGRPRRGVGIGSMIRLGGALTFRSIVIYAAYNTDKMLLGRFWGATALGSYGRAYQLLSIPTDSLNGAVGGVALSALSRLSDQPERLRVYFLKAYSLVLALTVPCTIACAVFSPEIVAVVLGSKWGETAAITRLLAPTILVFGMINPAFWLMFSAGLMGRSFWMAVVMGVLVISACVIGLPYGSRGVAAAYSTAMTLWLVPHLVWSVHGTVVRPSDLARAAGKPIVAGMVAALACVGFRVAATDVLSIVPRLAVGMLVLAAAYLGTLLVALRQLPFYSDLLKTLFPRRPSPAPS